MRFFVVLLVVLSVACSRDMMAVGQGEAAGADAAADEATNSILLESVMNGDIDGIHRALEAQESIDTTNVNGWSAAHFAVSNGNYAALEELINAGIDLNLADSTGYTALMMAAKQVSIDDLMNIDNVLPCGQK